MEQHKIEFNTAVSVVIANMIGTGVFTSLGFQVMGLSSVFSILFLWILGGLIALCGALTGLAGGASKAVGHEAGTLFVADQDMLDPRARQGAIHLDIVNAGHAEDRVDAIGFEQADQGFSG